MLDYCFTDIACRRVSRVLWLRAQFFQVVRPRHWVIRSLRFEGMSEHGVSFCSYPISSYKFSLLGIRDCLVRVHRCGTHI
jgi:hypothetical protein